MRREGLSVRYVIWTQTGQPRPATYYSAQKEPEPVEQKPRKPPQPATHLERQAQPMKGPFSHMPRIGGKALRNELAVLTEAQGRRCYLCRRRFGDGWARATFDHVTPFSQCGVNRGNGLAACAMCNYEKGDRMPTEAEIAVLARVNVEREKLLNVGRTRAKRSVYDAWEFS